MSLLPNQPHEVSLLSSAVCLYCFYCQVLSPLSYQGPEFVTRSRALRILVGLEALTGRFGVARTVIQRLRKCPLEIQLVAPCEDVPHIDMDEHCE